MVELIFGLTLENINEDRLDVRFVYFRENFLHQRGFSPSARRYKNGIDAMCKVGVKYAKSEGLELLGFSEHCPLPDREYQKGNRMEFEELPLYEADILKAQQENPDIRLLIGAECDWLPDEAGFYKDGLLGERHYDYISCSVHDMPDASGEDHYLGHFKTMDVGTLLKYVKGPQ